MHRRDGERAGAPAPGDAPASPAGLYEKMKAAPFAGRLDCSASAVEAGSWQEIVLDYEVGSSGVADGATFKATFKFYSDWALFQTVDPAGANYVSAEYHAGPLAPGQSPASVQHLAVRFDQKGHERPYQKAVIVDVIDGYLNMGDHIVIRLGDRRAGGPGTRVQTFVDDDFRFRAYVDPLGTSRFVAVPDVSLRIVAAAPARLSLVGPRFARPGAAAPFRLSALDRWGNIVGDFPSRARVSILSGDETIAVREIALPKEGWASAGIGDIPTDRGDLRLVAELDARGVPPAEAFLSVFPEAPAPRAFYADLHVHAHDTVGTNSPSYNAAFARDIGGVDVFGYTANDFQITDENWRAGVAAVNASNAPGRFVTYPVQEWCGSSTAGGDHKVIFLGDEAPAFPFDAEGRHNRTLSWNEDAKDSSRRARPLAGERAVASLWACAGKPSRRPACRRAPLYRRLAPSRARAAGGDRLRLGALPLALSGRDRGAATSSASARTATSIAAVQAAARRACRFSACAAD